MAKTPSKAAESAQQKLDREFCEAWNRAREAGMTLRGTAKAMGYTSAAALCKRRRGVEARLKSKLPPISDRGPAPAKNLPVEIAALPESDVTLAELLEHRKAQFRRKAEAETARRLIPVKVPVEGPYAMWVFGDPHVDDDGTDIEALERHAKVIRDTHALYGINAGDTTNNWIGRLARLYGEQGTTAEQSWKLAEWFIGLVGPKWLFMIGGNHDCLDFGTEALTKRGWMKYEDILPNDLVLGMNRHTGALEWQPILVKFDRDNDEKMVAVERRAVSMMMTPGHRVLHDKRNWKRTWSGKYDYCRADSLPPRFRVPVSGYTNNTGVTLTDDEIELAGWFLTDGSVDAENSRASLYQSKDPARIRELLAACKLAHRETVRERKITSVCGRDLVKPPMPQREFRLTAEATRDLLWWLPEKGKLPWWAADLTDYQFDVLLDGLIAGDGTWDGSEDGNCAVLHGTKEFLESVQIAAIQHGWRATLSVARENDYRLNLARTTFVELERGQAVASAPAAEKVWCLTVPFGNFMVRRDGKPHITGNCWSGSGDPIKWIAREHKALYESSEVRVELKPLSGKSIIINARHDFSGHSQWNPAHGVGKAAQMGVRDDVILCGHKHVTGYMPLKDPESKKIMHCLQVASYKVYDRYARERGFRDQAISPGAMIVVNPHAETAAGLVHIIHDFDMGVAFLKFLRSDLDG